jgi:hypothetical protein
MLQSVYTVQATLHAQTASCFPPRHASASFPTRAHIPTALSNDD